MIYFGRYYEPLFSLDTMLIVVALAWCAANVWRNLRERSSQFTILSALGTALMAWGAWFWWNEAQAWRPLLAATPVVTLAFAHLHCTWRSKRFRHAATTLCFLVIVNVTTDAFLSNVPPLGMEESDPLLARSSRGAYDAIVVWRHEFNYVNDYVALRPSGLSAKTLFDYPHRYVASFMQEGDILALRWSSSNDLVVTLRPGTQARWTMSFWKGITIHYVIDPRAKSHGNDED